MTLTHPQPTQPTKPSRARLTICIVAAVACAPYAALKILWIFGSDIGTEDAAAADLMHQTSTVVANVITLGMELSAVGIVVGLTFVRRIPPLLLLGPVWVGTGLLAPFAFGLPLGLAAQGIAGGSPAPDDGGLHGWVFAVVYGGFITQTPLLIGAFVLHIRHRWPWVFRLRGRDLVAGSTYDLQLLMARTALVVTALLGAVYVLWTIDADAFAGPSGFETVAQRTFVFVRGLLPVGGAVGVYSLVRQRRSGSMFGAVAAAWTGSGAAFAAVCLPSMDQTGFESFVNAVSGMSGVALAITGLLVLIDARPDSRQLDLKST